MQTLIFGEDKDGDGIPDDARRHGTAFGQDDAEFNIFNTDRQLAALQTAVTMLRPLPEQKALVYFASGLRLNGVDNQAQLRATTNAALRANVSLYPDRRARPGGARRRWATRRRPSPGGIGMFSGQPAQTVDDRTSSGRRTRSTRWPRTRAARRCSTTTICRSASCRPPRRVTSYYIARLLQQRTRRSTASSTASRSR